MPIFFSAAIFSMHISGVPQIEKALIISGVTAADGFWEVADFEGSADFVCFGWR